MLCDLDTNRQAVSACARAGSARAVALWMLNTAAPSPPTSAPPTNRAIPAPRSGTTAGAQTVLVVDDRADNLEAAKTALEGAGYRVLLASEGESAIAVFVAEDPDCVLLDVRMPGLDGFAVCKRIRALPRGVDTPIVFLTALRDVDTFDQALRSGGDDFLTKPVQSTELLVRVQSALLLRRMRVELREHYDLLKHQRDALQRVQLQKERLMAFVVHDLKNPVNSMDLHAQVLLHEKDLPPAVRESAAHIRTEARQLTRMILNLLDLSKGDEGRLSPRMSRVDVRLLAPEVVAELNVLAQSRDVTLECAADIEPIRADEDLLRRTLTNLVENALRHAPPASVVRLTAAADADGTEFRVIDAGAGVPPEMRDKIFDPFVQLESGSERPPPSRTGRGLGLAFCKLTAEAHGGRIWVEDAPSGASGAAFCLRLPHQA